MNQKKPIGLIITCIILAVFAACFGLLAILEAFEVPFVLDFEWAIIKDWEWADFNMLTFSLVACGLFVAAIVIVLVIADDKNARLNSRQKRQNKYFGG